jgi:hypothetical protein
MIQFRRTERKTECTRAKCTIYFTPDVYIRNRMIPMIHTHTIRRVSNTRMKKVLPISGENRLAVTREDVIH